MSIFIRKRSLFILDFDSTLENLNIAPVAGDYTTTEALNARMSESCANYSERKEGRLDLLTICQ